MNNYNMTNLTLANIQRAIAGAVISLHNSEVTGTRVSKIDYIDLQILVKVARNKLLIETIPKDNKNDKV